MPATARRPKRATKKKQIGRNPIKDSEIAKATKLAQRKNGVTRRQLATTLKVSESRAATILSRVKKVKAAPLGAGAGKACRTLVFKLKKN
jgi:predicted HTH transcriptional regulator